MTEWQHGDIADKMRYQSRPTPYKAGHVQTFGKRRSQMDLSIKSIRTLLVDDEPQFLKTASWFLSTEQRYRVVGSVSTIADMQAAITAYQLDLILIDLQMVLNNGDEFGRIVKTLAPAPKIILMSLFDTEHCRHHAHLYNADDCIAKVQFADEIVQLTQKFFRN